MNSSQYVNSEHSKKNLLPILITIGFFLITLYVASFHHNYWILDHDGQIYLDVGKEILAGNGENVKLHNALVGDKENKIYLVKLVNSKQNILDKTSTNYINFVGVQNTNNRKTILQTYDQLLNNKYQVQLNQKTIDRVKNYFK